MWKCDICGKSLASKQRLQSHLNRKFKCRPPFCQPIEEPKEEPVVPKEEPVVEPKEEPVQPPQEENMLTELQFEEPEPDYQVEAEITEKDKEESLLEQYIKMLMDKKAEEYVKEDKKESKKEPEQSNNGWLKYVAAGLLLVGGYSLFSGKMSNSLDRGLSV